MIIPIFALIIIDTIQNVPYQKVCVASSSQSSQFFESQIQLIDKFLEQHVHAVETLYHASVKFNLDQEEKETGSTRQTRNGIFAALLARVHTMIADPGYSTYTHVAEEIHTTFDGLEKIVKAQCDKVSRLKDGTSRGLISLRNKIQELSVKCESSDGAFLQKLIEKIDVKRVNYETIH